MPALRLINRRRRSSAMLAFNPAKPGIYGIGLPHPAQKPVTFAPNVTPGTYVEPDDGSDDSNDPPSPSLALFPPSQVPAPPPSRRRVPPGKRRSLGYIPRPPNAFMLFRADFVRQKHVPGSIETNHGSLSKIIGNCWRALPLEEKRLWEVKAKHAKAEHKAKYPNYRFRPIHNKNKEKKKEKALPTPEDERRCEEVAQLLLEGKKGEQLAEAVRNLDRMRSQTPVIHPAPVYPHRRSSSVPLPNDYTMYNNNFNPSAGSFLPHTSRPVSPMLRQHRMMVGQQQRRPSSAGPAFFRNSWTNQLGGMTPNMFQHEDLALPEPDPALLNTFSNFNFQPSHDIRNAPFNVNELITSLPPHARQQDTHLGLGPLEPLAHHHHHHHQDDILSRMFTNAHHHQQQQSINTHTDLPELDMNHWLSSNQQIDSQTPSSHTSSTYSGSPQPSDNTIPLPVFAPQPIRPDSSSSSSTTSSSVIQPTNHHVYTGMEGLTSQDVWNHPHQHHQHHLHHQDMTFGTEDLSLNFSSNNGGCSNIPADYSFVGHPFDFGPADGQMADFIKNETC